MKRKLYALLPAGTMALSLAVCGTTAASGRRTIKLTLEGDGGAQEIAAGMEVIARMDQAGIDALGSYAGDVEVTVSLG